MKRGQHKWWVGGMVLAASLALGSTARAADVSDADRSYRNFTFETATVSEGQLRLELRGMKVGDQDNVRLNTVGLRLRRVFQMSPDALDDAEVSGGTIELLTSYGFAKNAEVGMSLPMVIESVRADFSDGSDRRNGENIGDIQLYGKVQMEAATNCRVGTGVNVSLPTAPGGRYDDGKGFGTGEMGVAPFVSTRYQKGPLGAGANLAYEFYSGDISNVFHYGTEAFYRPSDRFVLRTEIAGRVFSEVGENWHDLTLLPGVDYRLTDYLTVRPTGLVGLTHTAMDWGIGLGLAATF